MPVKERVEGMKKLFLGALFATEKLDVIDQEQIGLSITLSKLNQIIVLNGVDELVDKQLTGKIHHLRILFLSANVLADCLHEVGLAQTNAAIDKERVVSPCRRLGNGKTGRVCNLIVRTDDE